MVSFMKKETLCSPAKTFMSWSGVVGGGSWVIPPGSGSTASTWSPFKFLCFSFLFRPIWYGIGQDQNQPSYPRRKYSRHTLQSHQNKIIGTQEPDDRRPLVSFQEHEWHVVKTMDAPTTSIPDGHIGHMIRWGIPGKLGSPSSSVSIGPQEGILVETRYL